jgi:hypothetical protein
MKSTTKLLTVLILLMCTIVVNAQDSTMYKLKIEKSESMQETGTIMMGGGFLLLAACGFVYQFVNPLKDEIKDNSIVEGIGIGIVSVAGALIVPGLIVDRIGKHREKKYQIKLDNLRSGLYISPDQIGLKLTFNF